ncbi:MAG: hemolysin family protein [Phocaeicola sp.]|nr:hemolysin family protein [Phocaeicola sp.]MDD7447933.1 hemolysin family protein [Prevotellaceae bacterium]MDY5939274.1 hemolysin family protein [Phocaeicola sp.]
MELIVLILLSIVFSAYFSGMEIAFVSSNKLRFELEKGDSLSGRILTVFYNNPSNFISTMLVGNNIVLVLYGIWMAKLIGERLIPGLQTNEALLVAIETIISTLIILFSGEFLPKTLFKINPNFILKFFCLPTFLFYILLYPVSKFATWLSTFLLRLVGVNIEKNAGNKTFTKVDLDHFIQSSIGTNVDTEAIDAEVKIFQNVLDFSNIKVRDCMVPRTEVVAVDTETSLEELKATFIKYGYSKIIVYKEDIDHVIGYIHSSEMFKQITDWTTHLRSIPIVPETMTAQNLMRIFAQQKRTIAAVVDEFGGTSGVVALEDLLEELLGEIEDEHDTPSLIATQTGENEYVLSGRVEIEEANEKFGLELPEDPLYQTIGGLILSENQSFPRPKDIITIGKYQFQMLKVTAQKIELVKLRVIE